MALETGHHGRKPGIAVAMETVLVLLAFGPLELSWALAPWDKEEIKRRNDTRIKRWLRFFHRFVKIQLEHYPDLSQPLFEPFTIFSSFKYFCSTSALRVSESSCSPLSD